MFLMSLRNPFGDLTNLPWKWLQSKSAINIQSYRCRFIGFQHQLKGHSCRSSDSIKSVARIKFLIQVHTYYSGTLNLGLLFLQKWFTRTLWPKAQYRMSQDKDFFEVCGMNFSGDHISILFVDWIEFQFALKESIQFSVFDRFKFRVMNK